MYLSTSDMMALVIALTSAMTLTITTAIANRRLTRKVSQLRSQLASLHADSVYYFNTLTSSSFDNRTPSKGN